MKRNTLLTLTVCALLLAMLLPMAACTSSDSQQGAADPSTETEAEPMADPIDPESLGKAAVEYVCQDGSLLSTYKEKTAEDFAGVCSYYVQNGYLIYSSSEKAGNLFATYVKDREMAHVYWLKSSGELNIIFSEDAGDTLPPTASPEIMEGDCEVTITQMRDGANVNGMCYIVQLPDGSFIVYDGSYEKRAKKVMAKIEDLHKGEGDPLIRAWILTHSHNDHYPAFSYFCNKYADDVKVEYVIIAPIDPALSKKQASDNYLNDQVHEDIAKLGAKTVYAHTGMEFSFGDFKLEILLAADDLYKVGNHGDNFNNTSIVSRIYKDDYNALFLADIGKEGAGWMMDVYGSYLQSDICQVSHHGVEDVPLEFYEIVQASILYYPCNLWLYDQTERHYEVRKALEERSYTKEILIAGIGEYTRAWGTEFAEDAPLSMPDYKKK